MFDFFTKRDSTHLQSPTLTVGWAGVPVQQVFRQRQEEPTTACPRYLRFQWAFHESIGQAFLVGLSAGGYKKRQSLE